MTNQQAPEIYTLHTVPSKGERPWSGIYGVRADAEHDAKVLRDATGRDWSVVRLVVADTNDRVPEAIAKLRHLYQNMVNGAVRDTASAKRIAEGLLAPAIEALERATPPAEQQAAPKAAPRDPFQHRVQPWLLQCFGAEIAADTVERNHRFLEEALELVQSTGCTQSEAHQLVDYVFGRPVGEPAQEVGGVMVTLAALCLANGLDMHNAGEIELARIWTKVEAIRAKQAAKPKHLPLPQAAPQPATAPLSDDAKDVVRDAAFEAVRKKLCALPRFSFLSDGYGVRRVPDKSGSWIAFDAAHALFDPVAVDAALAAQGGKV